MSSLKTGILLWLPLTFVLMVSSAYGQGYYRFLGDPVTVPDQTTPRFGITYNTQGFDNPTVHRTTKMIKRGATQADVDAVANFPGNPNAIPTWIDDAFQQTRLEFDACGGSLAANARNVSPKTVTVTIEPTGWYEPELGYAVAGAYYPSTHQIRVLNIYYIWSGADNGWLRQCSDLLQWEMENYFATELNIQAEPRTKNWPCDAPAQ